jgi:hypothetical protein
MGVSWGILAPFFIALAITFAFMLIAVVVTGAIRGRDYRHFENKSKEGLAREFPLPTVDQSTAEERRKSLSPFLDKAHKSASATQTRYYNAVVGSAGCLVLAFLALAFGTLRSEDWPFEAWLHWQSLEGVLSWLDAIAMLFVLFLFLIGRKIGARWITVRAGTEFLRQYQILSVVFPSAISPAQADDLKTQFDIEAALVAARVQDGSITDIAARIERFWSTRTSSIERRTLTDADLTTDALLVYLQRRVRRQLGWFIDSKGRLEHIAKRRNWLLLGLYLIAAWLAVTKLVLFLYGCHSAYLPPFLLIVTGMSAAMTAYYINQNSRSLIHRYYTQRRFITDWLEAIKERSKKFADLPSLTIDLAAKNEMRAQILRFEDLMIGELIDWIHITSHDAIELAP